MPPPISLQKKKEWLILDAHSHPLGWNLIKPTAADDMAQLRW